MSSHHDGGNKAIGHVGSVSHGGGGAQHAAPTHQVSQAHHGAGAHHAGEAGKDGGVKDPKDTNQAGQAQKAETPDNKPGAGEDPKNVNDLKDELDKLKGGNEDLKKQLEDLKNQAAPKDEQKPQDGGGGGGDQGGGGEKPQQAGGAQQPQQGQQGAGDPNSVIAQDLQKLQQEKAGGQAGAQMGAQLGQQGQMGINPMGAQQGQMGMNPMGAQQGINPMMGALQGGQNMTAGTMKLAGDYMNFKQQGAKLDQNLESQTLQALAGTPLAGMFNGQQGQQGQQGLGMPGVQGIGQQRI